MRNYYKGRNVIQGKGFWVIFIGIKKEMEKEKDGVEDEELGEGKSKIGFLDVFINGIEYRDEET